MADKNDEKNVSSMLTEADILRFARTTAASADDGVLELQKIETQLKNKREELNTVAAPVDATDAVRTEFDKKKARLREEIKKLEQDLVVVRERTSTLEKTCDVYQEVASWLRGGEKINFRKQPRLAPIGDISKNVADLKKRIPFERKMQVYVSLAKNFFINIDKKLSENEFYAKFKLYIWIAAGVLVLGGILAGIITCAVKSAEPTIIETTEVTSREDMSKVVAAASTTKKVEQTVVKVDEATGEEIEVVEEVEVEVPGIPRGIFSEVVYDEEELAAEEAAEEGIVAEEVEEEEEEEAPVRRTPTGKEAAYTQAHWLDMSHSVIGTLAPYNFLSYNNKTQGNKFSNAYGFGIAAEYRLRFKYFFAGASLGMEWFIPIPQFSSLPILIKVGGTYPITDNMRVDLYAGIGGNISSAYANRFGFGWVVGADFEYALDRNMAILGGLELKGGSGTNSNNDKVSILQLAVPYVSFQYTF